MTDPYYETLTDSLPGIAREAEHQVLDALYCALHNPWVGLSGNTEESDLEWFATASFEHIQGHRWDRLSETERDAWRDVCRGMLVVLPRLFERRTRRYQAHAAVLKDMLHEYWAVREKE